MSSGVNPKPFGLGFKSPRKQFHAKGGVHCSEGTVTHLTFTVARLTPLTRVDHAIYRRSPATFSSLILLYI